MRSAKIRQFKEPVVPGTPDLVTQLLDLPGQFGPIQSPDEHLLAIEGLVIDGSPLHIRPLGEIQDHAMGMQLGIAGPAKLVAESGGGHNLRRHPLCFTLLRISIDHQSFGIGQSPLDRPIMRLDQAHVPTDQGLHGKGFRGAESKIRPASVASRCHLDLAAIGEASVQEIPKFLNPNRPAQPQYLGTFALPPAGASVLCVIIIGLLVIAARIFPAPDIAHAKHWDSPPRRRE